MGRTDINNSVSLNLEDLIYGAASFLRTYYYPGLISQDFIPPGRHGLYSNEFESAEQVPMLLKNGPGRHELSNSLSRVHTYRKLRF